MPRPDAKVVFVKTQKGFASASFSSFGVKHSGQKDQGKFSVSEANFCASSSEFMNGAICVLFDSKVGADVAKVTCTEGRHSSL